MKTEAAAAAISICNQALGVSSSAATMAATGTIAASSPANTAATKNAAVLNERGAMGVGAAGIVAALLL